jgi:SAM-dependent methyltransferase
MLDLFGKAIFDYQTYNQPENLITSTSISEEDEMDVSYLFRNFKQMPKIEQKALSLAHGNVLDIGCGAGSHSLYLQNERQLNITAVDISAKAIEVCQLRGVEQCLQIDFMQIENQKFDTIMLLMNGTGICGTFKNLARFLNKLKHLLNPHGQILIDSSDIIYMFDEDDDGGKWITTDKDYYGELEFEIKYKGEKEATINWLYLDYNSLQNAAYANGLQATLVLEGEHYDYLARLTHL